MSRIASAIIHRSFIIGALLLASAVGASAQTRLFVTVQAPTPRGLGPVPGATVIVLVPFEETVVTRGKADAQGRATLIVESGRGYLVTAQAPGFEPQSDGSVFAVKGDMTTGVLLAPAGFQAASMAPIDQVIEGERRHGVLEGLVTDEDGRALTGVAVNATSSVSSGSGRSDATGRFRLRVPAGTYTVTTGLHAVPAASRHDENAPPIYPPSEPVVALVDSNRVTSGLAFRLSSVPRMMVQVQVMNGGQPVSDASVIMYAQRDPWQLALQAEFQTEADGIARMGAVLPGRALLIVVKPGDGDASLGAVDEVDLTAGESPIVVQVTPAARVEGRVRFVGRDRPLHTGLGIRVLAQVPGQPVPPHGSHDVKGGGVSEDGAFSLSGLIGPRCLRVVGIDGNWRLSALMHGSTNVTNRVIDFKPGDVIDVVAIVERGYEPYGAPKCGP